MLTPRVFSEKVFDTRIKLKKMGVHFSDLYLCQNTKLIKISLESNDIKTAKEVAKKFKNLKIVIMYY